jgi:2-succinyl-6-hydroxy-2,4-cyclohexadiene-1-carboxylate synthase
VTTTLLLHGFTGSSRSWSGVLVDGLASLGRAPVLVDLPGHGRHRGASSPDHFTLAGVFESILEASRGASLDLVGYSMGGRMALAFAVIHPDRVSRLVLESASPGLATEGEREARRAADEALARSLEENGIEAFVDAWQRQPLFESQATLPPGVLAEQRARRLRNDPASLGACLRGLGTGSQPSFWDALPGLDIPTLVLAGEADTKFVEIGRRMVRALPRGRLAAVPGAGHAVHLERPDAWLAHVGGFLAGGF